MESRLDSQQRSVSKLSQSEDLSIAKPTHAYKSHLTASNTSTTDLLVGLHLPNYVGMTNHGFAITTAALVIVLANVKNPPAP